MAKKSKTSTQGKAGRARIERFCALYAADPEANGTRAAVSAGYSEKTAASQASRLLKREDVRERIRELRADIVAELGLTAAHMTQRLNEIYMRCMAAKPVTTWDSEKHAFVETGEWRHDSRGALKASEMIAKLCGLITESERPEISLEMGGELERAGG